MPFNVIDRSGNPIGIICERFMLDNPQSNLFLIGRTHQRLEEMDIDMEKIRGLIAYGLECKSILGSIKEEKFDQTMREIWKHNFSHHGYYDERFLIKRLMLQRFTPIDEYVRLERFTFTGYILIDGTKMNFIDNTYIMLDEEMDYIQMPFSQDYGIPVFFKIKGIPICQTEAVRTGQPWEMNHYHTTRLPVISGNASLDLLVGTQCLLKDGMNIQVFIEKEKIAGIFGDGIYYKIV